MALPSQQQRGGGMGPRLTGGRSRRRRRRSRRVLGVVVLLAIVGVVVWQWPSIVGSGPDEAVAAGDQSADTEARSPDSGAARLVVNQPRTTGTRPRNTTNPPAPREREFTMGSSNDAAARTNRDETESPERTYTRDEPRNARPSQDPDPPRTPNTSPDPNPDTTPGAVRGVTELARTALERSATLLASNRPIEARDTLNRALHDGAVNATDADVLRTRLAEISAMVTFSPRAYPDDETADTYTVRSGDALSVIPRRANLDIDYRLIQRLNNISDPSRIRAGQKLKVLKGPFHAVVDKSAFRLDLYADQTDSRGNRLFLRSFPVGLGEYGTTPIGSWVVRQGGKVVNPAWVNPRTGEKFDKDDPDIPIGEHWIALEGTDPETELLAGYGIHGTNEPESIGMEMSMGCIRMLAHDVELIYEVLSEGSSTVRIVE